MMSKPGPDSTLQMEQARQLLELGHTREALFLMMDALLRELDYLREVILLLRDSVLQPPEDAESVEPEPAPLEFYWPEPKARTLH